MSIEYRKHEILSGLFIVLAVLVFALFAFKVSDLDLLAPFRGPSLPCRSYFDDVRSLGSGAPVKVGGQTVGKVREVRMVERALTGEDGSKRIRQLVEVEFEITDGSLKLHPATAFVELQQDSPLAPHFLDLDPGEWPEGEPTVSAASGIDGNSEALTILTRPSAGLTELIDKVEPIVDRLGAILGKLDRDVFSRGNLDSVSAVIANLESLSKHADGVLAKVEDVVEGRGELGESLRRSLNEIARVSSQLDGRIQSLQSSAEGLLAETRETVGLVRELVAENRSEIAETTRRLRRAMWQAEMALRKVKVDPSVILWGSEEREFEVDEMDDSWLRSTGRLKPYEQRDEADAKRDE